jgi:hypothetical protein
MLKVTNREEEGYLELDNIKNFPCEDLLTLDRLWVEYSKKHGFEFGFSVQKQIYVECGGKLDFSFPSNETWEKFCKATAWKSDGKWVNYSREFFKDNFINIKGQLPSKKRVIGRNGLRLVEEDEWSISFLASRLVKCKP